SSSDETDAARLIAMVRAGVRLRKIDGAAFGGSVGGVSIHAFAENPPGRAKRNNSSLVLRLAFGRTAFLFTGDIEAPAERALLAEGVSLEATVLKVPHHGSKSSSTPEFVEAVHPAVAVISDGYMNRFHFPAPAVVERYRSAGATVLRTDLDGAIITRATRQEVEVREFRGGGFLVRQEGLRQEGEKPANTHQMPGVRRERAGWRNHQPVGNSGARRISRPERRRRSPLSINLPASFGGNLWLNRPRQLIRDRARSFRS